MNRKQFTSTLKFAFPLTIPVLTGFILMGAVYGVIMAQNGYGIMWSLPTSITAFAGSSQFLGAKLLVGAFNPLNTFFLCFLVNARYVFFGISMLGKYRGTGRVKPLLAFWLCDETFSINCTTVLPPDIKPKHFYCVTSVLDYIYWLVGTSLGAILGSFIKFDTTGFDFVLTCLFIVLFVDLLREKKNIIFGVIGVLCTVISRIIFGSDNTVIGAMAIILLVLTLGRPWFEKYSDSFEKESESAVPVNGGERK